jgi:hypothetical protein
VLLLLLLLLMLLLLLLLFLLLLLLLLAITECKLHELRTLAVQRCKPARFHWFSTRCM